MKVICPKCQFENQADPNASRVVCARCATIVDVGMGLDEGLGGGYNNNFQPGQGGTSGNYGNAGNNFGATYSGGYEQTIRPGTPPPAPPSRPQLPEGDTYATRIDDDFDDVLDIPRPNAQLQNYQYNENAPAFDDVFSSPSSYETMVDARIPNDAFQSNPYQGQFQGNAYQESEYGNAAFDQPNYGAPQQDAEFMGWPVLPEDTTDPGIPPTSAFSKRNSLVKIALPVLAAALALIFLYSYISSSGNKKAVTPKTAPVSEEENSTTASNLPANTTNENKPPAGPAGAAPLPVNQTAKPVVIPPVTTPGQPANTAIAKPSATVLVPKETKVTPPVPEPVAKKEPVETTPNKGNITIQAGSFNDQAQAIEKANRLKASNINARVVAATIPGRGTWYRVQIGRFPSREQAASYASQLRSKGAVQEVLVTPVN